MNLLTFIFSATLFAYEGTGLADSVASYDCFAKTVFLESGRDAEIALDVARVIRNRMSKHSDRYSNYCELISNPRTNGIGYEFSVWPMVEVYEWTGIYDMFYSYQQVYLALSEYPQVNDDIYYFASKPDGFFKKKLKKVFTRGKRLKMMFYKEKSTAK